MEIMLRKKIVRVKPTQAIGKGGEADVFALGNGTALKLFKGPDHPDLANQPLQQKLAQERLEQHQQKLPQFPSGLPAQVIAPLALAEDRLSGRILGYEMKLVDSAEVLARYSDPGFRLQVADPNSITRLFLTLRSILEQLHRKRIVVGDFNDLNVLVRGEEPFLIDTDSFQYGGFPCPVFTARVLDPLIAGNRNDLLIPLKGFNSDSDWFAFATLLMECLLFVHPYGGVFRPKNPSQKIPQPLRPLERITAFHPDVRYPKSALPPEVLPEDLLQHFHEVFARDQRGIFPEKLLRDLHWSHCSSCGFEHARSQCPRCLAANPLRTRETVVVRGPVTARRIFSTPGRIVAATMDSGTLRFLYHEQGAFLREGGEIVFRGSPRVGMTFACLQKRTMVGERGSLTLFHPEDPRPSFLRVDSADGIPQFAANSNHLFWIDGGTLFREEPLASEPLGEVLSGLTRFWVGPLFGFGFYRAAHLHVAFVFPVRGKGLHDRVRLPQIPGKLTGACCFFGDNLCWLFVTSQDQGRAVHQAVVIREDGTILAAIREEGPISDWLTTRPGKTAAGRFLLAATDNGIARLEVDGDRIIETRRFPDTEPFVHDGCSLFAGPDGLVVVDVQEIRVLRMG